jgi:hypothetical protein
MSPSRIARSVKRCDCPWVRWPLWEFGARRAPEAPCEGPSCRSRLGVAEDHGHPPDSQLEPEMSEPKPPATVRCARHGSPRRLGSPNGRWGETAVGVRADRVFERGGVPPLTGSGLGCSPGRARRRVGSCRHAAPVRATAARPASTVLRNDAEPATRADAPERGNDCGSHHVTRRAGGRTRAGPRRGAAVASTPDQLPPGACSIHRPGSDRARPARLPTPWPAAPGTGPSVQRGLAELRRRLRLPDPIVPVRRCRGTPARFRRPG